MIVRQGGQPSGRLDAHLADRKFEQQALQQPVQVLHAHLLDVDGVNRYAMLPSQAVDQPPGVRRIRRLDIEDDDERLPQRLQFTDNPGLRRLVCRARHVHHAAIGGHHHANG